MIHIGPDHEIFEQIERRRVKPLQIIEKQCQWMLRSREHTEEAPEHQVKAALRVLWRHVRDLWLFSDDERQLRNQVRDQAPVRTDCLMKRVAPQPQLFVAFRQKRSKKIAKRLRQCRIRNVTSVLVKLA